MRPCYFNVGLCACHTGPGCLADPPPTDADRAAAQAGRERDEDMSGMDQIDDTLDNWRGSVDSMRCQPELTSDEVEQLERTMAYVAATLACAFRQLAGQLRVIIEGLGPVAAVLARALEAWPSALNAKYHRCYRNRMGHR